MGQASTGTAYGGVQSSPLPNWSGSQGGYDASTTASPLNTSMPQATPFWAQAPNYGTFTANTGATSTPGALLKPESAPRVNMSAREAYVAPPKEAPAAGVGTRNQVGPARQTYNSAGQLTWTTFPTNHPDAPDYNGQNPGDWAAYGPTGYVPAGQKSQYSGKAAAKKTTTKKKAK